MIILKILLAHICIIAVLLLAALINTLAHPQKKGGSVPEADPERALRYAEKLSSLVKLDTVSVSGVVDHPKFLKFHELLKTEYPNVFRVCEYNVVDGGYILRWPGKSSQHPVCFLAHMDVVEANPDRWTHDPFGGEIADGRVYGRGSMDNKCNVMTSFQAVEECILEGIVPDQDIYLASSCGEEIGSPVAKEIADWLDEHGVRLSVLCDEGGGVTESPMPGLEGIFAMVGVYEKGFGNFTFTAKSQGGHSSSPGKNNPMARLARLVNDIETHLPFRYMVSDEVARTFRLIAPYCSFGLRFVLMNLWLFKPVIPLVIKRGNIGAMLGTTCVFTMASGSTGANVIPQEATVTANLRYSRWQGEAECLRILSDIAAKYDISVSVSDSRDASRPVDLSGPGFRLIDSAVKNVYPGIPLIPFVVTGGTDSRNFESVTDTVIRMSPCIYSADCLATMHGIDEYLDYKVLPGAVDYYKYLIKHSGELTV